MFRYVTIGGDLKVSLKDAAIASSFVKSVQLQVYRSARWFCTSFGSLLTCNRKLQGIRLHRLSILASTEGGKCVSKQDKSRRVL